MALTLPEQIAAAVQRSRNALITCPKEMPVDALASALALAVVLKAQGKVVDVAIDGYVKPPYGFLPEFPIAPNLQGLQQLTIKVKLEQSSLEQFSYDVKNGALNIYCTTRGGVLRPEDVSAQASAFRYDLIITTGAADLRSLGAIFSDHREFFERTPVINIDHQSSNEHYGQINLVDLTAAAIAEVVYDLLPVLQPNAQEPPAVDRGVATCLLAGLISATHSFRSQAATAKTLRIASALIAAGANRDGIVRSLFQSHSIAALRLWGRTLSRLHSDLDGKLVWAPVPETDFLEANATADDLPGLTDALLSTLPAAEIVVLLAQEGPNVTVRLTSLRNLNALQVSRQFSASGNRHLATWEMQNRSLLDAERDVIAGVKDSLRELGQI